MSAEHIGELAELYAMGSLDEPAARSVEQHVRTCDPCSQQLAAAAEAVAQIETARPQVTPPGSLRRRLSASAHAPRRAHLWTGALAAAAAFAIALIPTWVAVDRGRHMASLFTADEQALERIARAPSVERAAFMAGGRPVGNVLYGKRGDWYYVVVMHPKAGMQVAYVHGARHEMLGPVVMHGRSGTLYLPVNHRMEELALVENGTIVADAHLVY